MNKVSHRITRIAARNEGKIKSYESCIDVRAWSHDIRTRNCYLRDWIKCDMPICVVPICTLSSILSIMTYSSRERVSTRCHSRCQSKVLLNRLCSSCTVMKDCLSNNRVFEKYFIEEDLETIHWPCEKCFEILKSIKVFWKIVIEKVLKINLPKSKGFKCDHICSIQSVAKEWHKDIVDEALFVKSNTVLFKHDDIFKKETDSEKELEIIGSFNDNNRKMAMLTNCELRNVAVQTDVRLAYQKICKCTSANIKMINIKNGSYEYKDNEVIMIYKNNIKSLQHQFDLQKNEVDRLKKENTELNSELQHYRENPQKHLNLYEQPISTIENKVVCDLNSYDPQENLLDFNSPKDIDSEMIITLKNCKNENFRHVSVIQVLHKTNELNESKINGSYEKEDPIEILNKVHETFEAMVNREISIANKTDCLNNKNVIIKSTVRNIGKSSSTPSCSTSSNSMPSELNFESAKETRGSSIRSRK